MNTDRIRARDAAVRRLRVATAALTAAAGALALVFGLVAAKAFPGRAKHVATRAVARKKASPAQPPAQSAPSLVSAGTPAQPPSAQSSAPAPAAAPPVAVSGGS